MTGGSSNPKKQPETLELDWQLPARLRRPVGGEIQRQRRRKRAREAVVAFERHPIYEQSSTPLRAKPTVKQTETQAESYRIHNPEAQMNLPPYAGAFTKQMSAYRPRARRVARTSGGAMGPATAPATRKTRSARPPAKKPEAPRKQTRVASPLTGERDIAFNWQDKELPEELKRVAVAQQATASEAVVVRPRRRFALPIHLSIWPRQSSAAGQGAPSKKKLRITGLT
ncbi:hypothetical protein CL628_03000 [bacterium]|nr:hypothetical protein [bacterium]